LLFCEPSLVVFATGYAAASSPAGE
jgi:hypothetical protein